MMKTVASIIALFHLSTSQLIPAVTNPGTIALTEPPPPITITAVPSNPNPGTVTQAPPPGPIVTAVPANPNPNPNPPVNQAPAIPLGAYGQICRTPAPDTICQTSLSIASAETPGFTKCEKDFDCCLCQKVQCGNFIQGCSLFSSGNNGVYGVKDILIQGAVTGAHINCIGEYGCAEAEIDATNVKDIDAAGLASLLNAKISVTDPLEQFNLNCIGRGGCEGLQLEVIIPGPPMGFECAAADKKIVRFNRIACVGHESCKNMDLTIRNDGCNTIIVDMLECLEPDSCLGTNFNFYGDVQLNNCDLRGAASSTTTGIENCFENLDRLICPDPTSCRDAVRTLVNPRNGFSLVCANLGSCKNAELTINIDGNAIEPVKYIDSLKFGGEASGANAKIIINNEQGIIMNIQRIECSVLNSCAGTTIIIGRDVSVGEIICNTGTCRGCQIKIDELSPYGIPCDPNEVPAFHNTQHPGQGIPLSQGTQPPRVNQVGGSWRPIA